MFRFLLHQWINGLEKWMHDKYTEKKANGRGELIELPTEWVQCTLDKWVGANELNSFSNWVDSVPDSNNFQAAFTTNIIIIFSPFFVFVLGLFWQTHTKNTKYTVITNGNLCSVFGFIFLFLFFFLLFSSMEFYLCLYFVCFSFRVKILTIILL